LDDVYVYDTRPDWYQDDRPLDVGAIEQNLWESGGWRERIEGAYLDAFRGAGAVLAYSLGPDQSLRVERVEKFYKCPGEG
jgi:hypothetical protein